MRVALRSSHHAATAAVGGAIATQLAPGDVVVLTGPLGAGKTRLVQGIAAALGVPGRVTSPTFVLVRRHEGSFPVVHVDAYRLDDAAALATLDDDVLAEDVITCIEWGGRVAAALPDDRLDVELDVVGEDGDAPRDLVITTRGPGWSVREGLLRVQLERLAASEAALDVMDVA